MKKLKVEDVFPQTKPGRRPYCDAELSRYVIEVNERWKARGGGGAQFRLREQRGLDQEHCGNFARYKINGRWMCRRHAAFEVLDRIVERGEDI